MKQNSCWAQFKTARTTLEGNVCFNVARAGFNFNDGEAAPPPLPRLARTANPSS